VLNFNVMCKYVNLNGNCVVDVEFAC